MSARKLLFGIALLCATSGMLVAGAAAFAPRPDEGHHAAPPAAPAAKPAAKPDAHGAPATTPPVSAKPSAKGDAPASLALKPTGKAAPEKAPAEASDDPKTADAALALLREGNLRWVSDKEENPAIGPSRRSRLAEKGQTPFAAILTCADSRLPVERLFDRGVGELFVVRVAGNVAGTSETGTMEYGIEHLHIPLLVVMGHTKCGAVAAAASGADVHGALGELVSNISPAVERAKRNNPDAEAGQMTALAIKENVWQSITDLLRHSSEVRNAAAKGSVRIVGAVCDISTGKVEWMGEHPWQSELIEAFGNRSRNTAPASAVVHDEK